MTDDNNKKHQHYGHRQRKKEFFLKHGIDDLPEHEKLEFFLFFAIPTGDTNELAHRLIDRFGSFVEVMAAEYEDLLQVKGVKEHTACMICLFRMTARYYIMERKGNVIGLKNSNALNNYCAAMFLGAYNEQVRCIFLDNELKLINSEKICEGDFGKVELPLRALYHKIFNAKSNRVVISHNHPGMCIPSNRDIQATKQLFQDLKRVDVELVDHVIVGTDGVWSMREHEHFQDFWQN